jgi:hypothetical protein
MPENPVRGRNNPAGSFWAAFLTAFVSTALILGTTPGASGFQCPSDLGDDTFAFGDYCVHVYEQGGTFSAPHPAVTVVDLLIVGGGGGGGGEAGGGGGGAGGVVFRENHPIGTGDYCITVGVGGAPNQSGGNSTGFGLTALGGGYGGATGGGVPGNRDGGAGGSGGGAGHAASGPFVGGTATQPGSGSGGYGNPGGDRPEASNSSPFIAASGGGAGAAGQNAQDTNSRGGDGRDFSAYFGASVGDGGWFAGGGGGDRYNHEGSAIPGGTGGGGSGATPSFNAQDGMANTGGGGGGQDRRSNSSKDGSCGGSGIVIVRYEKPRNSIRVEGPVSLNIGDAVTIAGQALGPDTDNVSAELSWVSVADNGGTNEIAARISGEAPLPAGLQLKVGGADFNTLTLTNEWQTLKSGLPNEFQENKPLTYTLEVTDVSALAATEAPKTVEVEYKIGN